MRCFAWKLNICALIAGILCLLIPSYKSSNLIQFSTNQSMNSCRLGTGQAYSTNLGSPMSVGVADLFLLLTCHECLRLIVYTKLPGEILDYRNDSEMKNACVKRDISVSSCVERVKSCCINAEKCCSKQLSQKSEPSNLFCPITWDGIGCIDRTPANNTIKVECPKFIYNFLGQKLGEKKCLQDGNWLSITDDNITWEPTEYKMCDAWFIKMEYLLAQIKTAILVLSLMMLMVSLFIFIYFKSLRSQQRIKIHINLFFTLFLKSSFDLMNTVIIRMNTYSQLTEDISQSNTILLGNNEACKSITILLRYFQNSTFCWMLCEALFLYLLLFRTFEHISNIKMYLFIGWGLPSVYTIIYIFIRRLHPSFKVMDSQCWVEEPPMMEYLMRGPNIIVMLINIILLINILCLIRNLPAQPFDRNDWKRTLKAVLILVPLFGLHFILVAFQLETTNRYFFIYSVIQNLVQDSQGIAVSLAFCAMNQEVFNNIKQRFFLGRCTSHMSLPRSHSANRFSNSSRSSDHFRMIPLVQSQVATIIRRSNEERKVKELLINNKNHVIQ